jgi:hypothetical protein
MSSGGRDPSVLGMGWSVCGVCRASIPAKFLAIDGDVHIRKFCPEHGESLCFIRHDVDDYLRTQRFVKPAWIPRAFRGDATAACPNGCGICARHEQHLCMPIIEITNRCDLVCPICINASADPDCASWDMPVEEFGRVLDAILEAEGQIDVLNISGGEPTLHPGLLALVDEALRRNGIIRVSVSTNGLTFLREPALLEGLAARNIVVSLQFDGFRDEIYRRLRGRALLEEKREILAALRRRDVTTSLTMTAAAGVNDDQFHEVLDLLFASPNIISLMIQPLAFVGRAAECPDRDRRLSIPETIRLATTGHALVKAEDFVPLPCSSPLCFSLAFYLMTDDGRAVSVNRLSDAATLMDSLSNHVVFGLDPEEHEKLKRMIYSLWSGPVGAVPEGEAVLATLRGILREASALSNRSGFDPRQAFSLAERKVKSVFIHAFQDAETFDLARVRRCCQAYPQSDGRLIPACVRNVLRAGDGSAGDARA